MTNFDRPGVTVDGPETRRSAASRFGDLGERLSRTFGGFDRTRSELPAWEPSEEFEYSVADDETVAFFPPEHRFPVVRHGYDCAAVDQQLDQLEHELVEQKARKPAATAITREIDRIGEQTAAILQTAYEQAAEITRDAREQADKCLADAASNAVAITEEANRRLRELDAETDAVWQERTRLIDDARGVATSMLSLADGAAARFPSEQVKTPEPVRPPEPETTPTVERVGTTPEAPEAHSPEAPMFREDVGGQAPPRGDT